MIKSDDRRAALLVQLADYVLAEGLSASSLRPLAKAAHISDRMLLYYFKDKADIISAVLDLILGRLVTLLSEQTDGTLLPLEQLRPRLTAILFADTLWPYMRLWLEISALSAKGDPLFRDVGARMGRGFFAWGAAQLDSMTPEARERDAAQLLISIEGMLLLKSIGLDDVCQKAN